MPEQDQPNGNGDARADTNTAAAAFGDTLHDAEGYLKRQWRENPLQVAAAVAGIGLLLGLLLGRRR